jgi:uncharacterized protein YjbJ (UPF0337 family)
MGFLDKLLGRGKQAAGDVTGDTEMKQAGAHQEMQAAAESRADQAEDMAQDAREEAAEHQAERDTP